MVSSSRENFWLPACFLLPLETSNFDLAPMTKKGHCFGFECNQCLQGEEFDHTAGVIAGATNQLKKQFATPQRALCWVSLNKKLGLF